MTALTAAAPWKEGFSARLQRQASEKETAETQAAEERLLALAYCPQRPPVYAIGPLSANPAPPDYDDDPRFWDQVERTFGHWPAPVADVDEAIADTRTRRWR